MVNPAVRALLLLAAEKLVPVAVSYVQKKLSPTTPIQVTVNVTRLQ